MATNRSRRKRRVDQLHKFLEKKPRSKFPLDIGVAVEFFDNRFTKRKIAEYIDGIPEYTYSAGKISVSDDD